MPARRRVIHDLHRSLLHAAARAEGWLGGESTTLILLGALTGCVAGLAAVAFVQLVRAVGSLAWSGAPSLADTEPHDVLGEGLLAPLLGAARGEAASTVSSLLQPLLVVSGGLLLVAWLVRRLAPSAGGHGVPEVMEAVAQRGGLMRGRVGLVKLLTSSLNIGLGGSLGKEGPIVQVGAAFGSTLGRLFGVHGRPVRTLVGCGAAAGIAAVFDAPIGGVMFALEIVIGAYSLSAFAPVLIASVAGAVTSRRLLGDEPAFAIPASLREGLSIVSTWELGAYVVLGLVCGAASVGFTRLLYATEDLAGAWRAPWWLKALVAGLLVGGLGLLLPRVLGEGHDTLSLSLVADARVLPWTLLLALGIVKALATVLTIAGGGSGGVFAPSLFVGAMLGGVFGQLLELVFPGQVGAPGAYALVGMAALLAGTAHAPMTGILLLFELSDNYLLILPLMTSAVAASAVASRWLPDSIYTLPLSRKGILLRDHQDTAVLRRLRVGDAMQAPAETIVETTTFDRIVRRLLESDRHDFPVVDAAGRLTGVLSLDDLREFLREEHLDHLLLARDCARPVTTLPPQATLLQALEAFDREGVYELPVVSGGRLVGSLRRGDVLRTYRRALLSAAGGRGA